MKNRLKRGAGLLGIDGVDVQLVDRLILFAEELLRWNDKINLTSIRTMDEVVEKHLLDSLVLVGLLGDQFRVLDMGSGAGLPVIPLALAMPQKTFYSLDSVGKKINFQKHVKRLLRIKNLEIECARIEEITRINPAWQGFDVVVARAVADVNDLLKMALPVIKPGGMLIAMKGPEGEEELFAVKNKWQGWYDIPICGIKYQLPFSGAERCLLRIVKKSE
ncbi:MAG: 16S rRNA (guanine(527)-N(7))-methyltransferase RsmG [Desulfuromonadales bacterium]|nr:16S rRNA (guanine(527)-N(7))-methyltransferase RsmG [Desulfuromonadales bacterium]